MATLTENPALAGSDIFGAAKGGLADIQPKDAQLLETTTIESLRSIQHKDVNGNAISKSIDCAQRVAILTCCSADPDLSNPTRPRMERPLDTIRSFEKAIDSGYKRRSSMMRGGMCSSHSLGPTKSDRFSQSRTSKTTQAIAERAAMVVSILAAHTINVCTMPTKVLPQGTTTVLATADTRAKAAEEEEEDITATAVVQTAMLMAGKADLSDNDTAIA
jgi:hypothetical protein